MSPSGKLKSTFFWGNSDIHFFTIRTLDNSIPDFNIGAPAGDSMWLTDKYILYLNAWSSAPFIVQVRNDDSYDSNNVMYNLGVFKEDNYFQDSSFNFNIKSVNSNAITFFDDENNKEYKVEYSFDKNGKIKLKLVK